MGKSMSAKVMSGLIRAIPKYTAEQSERRIRDALVKGEKPEEPPTNVATRYEDSVNGRVFYVNEKGMSRYTVFYIHGGAYRWGFLRPHWRFIERIAKETNALVIAPGYRLAPFATYKEAYDLIVPLYRQYREEHPEKKVIMMGDSAGGGLALALVEHFKEEGIPLPDELVLFSPWVDISMENEEIPKYQPRDPMLPAVAARPAARRWSGDLDIHDPKVSPLFGDLSGIRNVTVFVGTDEILYPDVRKMFSMLDKDVSNELIVGEGMYHCYPLGHTKEAVPARNKVFQAILR